MLSIVIIIIVIIIIINIIIIIIIKTRNLAHSDYLIFTKCAALIVI